MTNSLADLIVLETELAEALEDARNAKVVVAVMLEVSVALLPLVRTAELTYGKSIHKRKDEEERSEGHQRNEVENGKKMNRKRQRTEIKKW